MPQRIITIDSNGLLSLGKDFAGKIALVEQIEKGTWIIKSGEFIPDSEKWLFQGNNLSKLEKAIEWAEQHGPTDNFNQILHEIENK